MKITKETNRNNKWIYYDVYEHDEQSNTYTLISKSQKLTDQYYSQIFDIIDTPITYLIKKYGWDISPLRWNALVSIYEDDLVKLVWDLYEMAGSFDNVSTNLAVDIILSGKKLKTNVIKEYINKLCRGDFTKQDGKDILNRLESGECAHDVYTDKKYEKLNNIGNVVEKIFNTNLDKFSNVNTQSKMVSWLVGQVMKETQGKCNPQEVKEIINQLLVEKNTTQ